MKFQVVNRLSSKFRRFSSKTSMTDLQQVRLLQRAREIGAIKYGDFRLAGGAKSKFYFDGRQLCMDPEGVVIISNIFLKRLAQFSPNYYGGVAIGAIPLIGAMTALQNLMEHKKKSLPLPFFVRKDVKIHGTQKQIEGNFRENSEVIMIEDTITTGGSLAQAVDVVRKNGGKVDTVFCILDRQAGGKELLKRHGINRVYSIWQLENEENLVPSWPTKFEII